MNDVERSQIRSVYRSLRVGSLLERRDALVIAGIQLAEILAKDFWHTYPSSNYTHDECDGVAKLALVEAASKAVDGSDVGSDVVAYLSGAIWKALSNSRDESPLIGPGDDTVRKQRNKKSQGQHVPEIKIESLNKRMERGDDCSKESSLGQADLFGDLLERHCEDLLDRTILVYRSQGHDNDAIATFTGYTTKTVSRRLAGIKFRYDSSCEALGA